MRNNSTFKASPGSYLLHTTVTTHAVPEGISERISGPSSYRAFPKDKVNHERHLCVISRSGRKEMYFYSRKYFGGHLEMFSEYNKTLLSTSE